MLPLTNTVMLLVPTLTSRSSAAARLLRIVTGASHSLFAEKILKKSHRIYGLQDIRWEGHRLRLLTGRLLATVEPDRHWAGMYRARLRDGHLTDMTNISRAKDAAVCLALSELNNAKPDKEAA